MGRQINGIININKAENMTSHDVVAILRGVIGQKRIGHTGTLDPLVRGVLPVCLGKATRTAEYISDQGKTYQGRLIFGFRTDTLDMAGEVIARSDKNEFKEEEIEKAFEHFRGPIFQKPPMYSAVKKDGKKLYELARQGKEVERPSRKIMIYQLDILGIEGPIVDFVCKCSKGTYIRQLVDDIGRYLTSYASLYSLVRTQVGPFHIEEAAPIMDIKEAKIDWKDYILPMDSGLKNFPFININEDQARIASNGGKLYLDSITLSSYLDFDDKELFRVYGPNDFIGLGYFDKEEPGRLRMHKVLIEKN